MMNDSDTSIADISDANKWGSLWSQYEQTIIDNSQIVKDLRTNQDTCRPQGITRVPSGEYLRHRSVTEGQRSDPCRTETLAMRRGKLAPRVIGDKAVSEMVSIFLKSFFEYWLSVTSIF